MSNVSLVKDYINQNDWRVKENSNSTYSQSGLMQHLATSAISEYMLEAVYSKQISKLHKEGWFHIHDLGYGNVLYCCGWSLEDLIREGFNGVAGKSQSKPAKHLSTLCLQMVNFLGCVQMEGAGAQAFNSVDLFLAPFVKIDNLSYKEVKQCIQQLIFNLNVPSRWGCVDTNTEVLSTKGFKKYNELKEGDEIYTWNNGKLEINKVNKVVIKPFKGKMHSYKVGQYNQTVTPEHRVLVKKFNKKEYEIKLSQNIFNTKTPFSLPASFNDSEIKGINYTDEEIMLSAILYTDGNIDIRNNNIHKVKIFKSEKRYGIDLIKSICESLNLKYTLKEVTMGFSPVQEFVFYGDSARKIGSLINNTKKDINNIFLNMNMNQAKLFINTWKKFDGNDAKFNLQYDNEEIGNKLQQIAILAGYTSYRTTKNKTNYIKIRQSNDVIPTERIEFDYDGLVWCPNVNNGTAIFRKDNNTFISGQSQSPFSNFTFDLTVPEDKYNQKALVGGKLVDFKYSDCQKEMDMINKAFLEVMMEGDSCGAIFNFPIPTYNITKDFDYDSEVAELLWEATAKYGIPYFSNFVNSDMKPSDVRSMCCRLRLDLTEIQKRYGGLFGAGDKTGSIGVVTLNLPRIGYVTQNKKDYFSLLKELIDVAIHSLNKKREIIKENMSKNLMPYTRRYLGTVDKHFSTIGIVGMHESLMNFFGFGLEEKEGQEFAKEILDFINKTLIEYQQIYPKIMYNLEATPAEGTSYRLAKLDKEIYGTFIYTSGTKENPYYTNSVHLPVEYTDNFFDVLDIQDDLQVKFTSGTVVHCFVGEQISGTIVKNIVKKVCSNYKLPYFSITPTFSVCQSHGYISGEHYTCPECGEECLVYSRIVGYYSPINNWNKGKSQEFKERQTYKIS